MLIVNVNGSANGTIASSLGYMGVLGTATNTTIGNGAIVDVEQGGSYQPLIAITYEPNCAVRLT